MNRMTIRIALFVGSLTLLAIGAVGGRWWTQRHDAHKEVTSAAASDSKEPRVLYWYDPMVPDQHFEKPGKSPFMDMELVPRYADTANGAGTGVRIDPGVQQNVGIRTAVVERGQLAAQTRVPATLSWDLRQESVVSARVDAIVSQLHVKAPFDTVRRGQPLAAVLAPEWGSAIAEAQALGKANSASAKDLQAAANARLHSLGLSGTRAGRDGSIQLLSPRDGVVSEILAREGQTMAAGMPLFRINGTATLWLEAAIPQAVVGGIGPGTKVEATVSAVPGHTFEGEVETLLPQIDAATRTQRARIVLRNDEGRLAPGMFAELTLQSEARDEVALVPSEAVIATGSDSRVIVAHADGRFEPVRVRTGHSSNGRTEILAGLKGGERIVVSGQFLIDSEASLSGALTRLGEMPAPATSTETAPPEDEPSSSVESRQTQSDDKQTRKPDAHSEHQSGKPSSPSQPPSAPRQRACPVQHWYDPMVPDQHFDKPGKSPFMDMMLVPKFGPGADPDCTIRDIEGAAGEETQP